jgi:predicted TIM-barrel fold metal-dependent hydrolase
MTHEDYMDIALAASLEAHARGDWPVAYQATDYPRWVETLAWAVSGCSDSELRRLFHDNAVTFYRL